MSNGESSDPYKAFSDAFNNAALALAEFSDNAAWGKILRNIAIIGANWENITKKMKGSVSDQISAYSTLAAAGLSATASFIEGIADEMEVTNKREFENQKGLKVASATMSMLAGIASAWSSSMQLGFPANVIVGSILSAMMATVGGMQIANIKKTKYGGDSSYNSTSSSSISPSAIYSILPPTQYTQDVQGASIQSSLKDTKYYVSVSEINRVGKRVNVMENESRY